MKYKITNGKKCFNDLSVIYNLRDYFNSINIKNIKLNVRTLVYVLKCNLTNMFFIGYSEQVNIKLNEI